jgi:hypothetical protein
MCHKNGHKSIEQNYALQILYQTPQNCKENVWEFEKS